MSSTNYSRQILKVVVAQLSQTIGFQSAQPITLDILAEILECYILLLAKTSREYAELASRTEPTSEDLAATFDRHKITLADLDDFMSNVEIPGFIRDTIIFPHPKENKLGFVDDPNNEEIQERINNEDKEHIYEYFPLMTRLAEPEQSLVQSTCEADQADKEQAGGDLNKQEPEATVTINGVVYEKNKWQSQFEAIKGLRKAMGELDIATRQPKAAQAKFPPMFHKPKSKLKKYASSKLQSNDYEDPNESDAKVNIPTNVDIAQVSNQLANNKSYVDDDMIDAVITKYSAQTSRRSPSPQRVSLTTMLDEPNHKLKLKKSTIPERLIFDTTNADETFSPIKITDDEDASPMKSLSSTAPTSTPSSGMLSQLKLKIPKSSIDKPPKAKKPVVNKDEKKSLKLIIDKKRMFNSSVEQSGESGQQKVTVIEKQTEEINISVINTSTATASEGKKANSAVISFDTDDEDYGKDNEENIQSLFDKEPLIWKPSCNIKSNKLFDELPNSAVSSPLLKSNFGTFPFTPKLEAEQNKKTDASVNRPKKPEVLPQSVFSPFKLTDLLDDSATTTTTEQVTESKISEVENQSMTENLFEKGEVTTKKEDGGENDENKHHKKHKKDKDHKKHHKKDKNHEKHESSSKEHKKKHKSKERDEKERKSSPGKEAAAAGVQENQMATPPVVPKIKLKLGDKPIAEMVKPVKVSKPDTVEAKKEDESPAIPKLLIKPMKPPVKEPTPSTKTTTTPKPAGSLKIKFKIDKNDGNEQQTYSQQPASSQNVTGEVENTSISMETSSMATAEVKSGLMKDKEDILEKLQSLEKADKHHKKHKKHKREAPHHDISLNLQREPGYENYITQEQLLNITESINVGSFLPSNSSSNLMNTINSVASVEKKKEKKKNKERSSFGGFELQQLQQTFFKAEMNEIPKLKIDNKLNKSEKKPPKIKSDFSPPPPPPALSTFVTQASMSKKSSSGTKSSSKDKKTLESLSMHSVVSSKFDTLLPQTSTSVPAVISAASNTSLQTTPSKVIDDSMPLDKILTNMSASSSSSQKQSTITGTTEIYDEVWICPSCKSNDDGTPMIGCDSCDDWYHWSCVGITQEPPENSPWYCNKCNFNDSAKRKKKKK